MPVDPTGPDACAAASMSLRDPLQEKIILIHCMRVNSRINFIVSTWLNDTLDQFRVVLDDHGCKLHDAWRSKKNYAEDEFKMRKNTKKIVNQNRDSFSVEYLSKWISVKYTVKFLLQIIWVPSILAYWSKYGLKAYIKPA
jgi:hypothetical protein